MELEFKGTDRFEILSRLGAGGMGVVYRAFDRRRQAAVALKTLHRLEPAAILRLKQEFRTIAHVAHPNLVTLHELISEGDLWFFTMDLVDGVNFLDWVRQGLAPAPTPELGDTVDVANNPTLEAGTLPDVNAARDMGGVFATPSAGGVLDETRLRDALGQLVQGISALHAAGMLHRDLKPSNILVQRDGRVAILDFGLATHLESRKSWQSQTDLGVSGTIEFMAPEQAEGASPTPANDWYSVGVMLFQALTGRLPFGGAPMKILVDKRRFDPPSPDDVVSNLPPDLVELCARLLRRDPTARPDEEDIKRRVSLRPDLLNQSSVTLRLGRGLVGREFELAGLRDAYQQLVETGSGVAIYVHGSSGMGKSALIERFLNDLPRDDVRILAGRCYEFESLPYKGLDPLIDELTETLSAMPKAECAALLPADALLLARLFPVLRQVESLAALPAAAEVPDPRELRRRAVEALRELLRRIARKRAVVLHIDDLQWGDRDSALLLADVLRPPEAPPLLLLGSYRTEEAETSAFLATFNAAVARHGRGAPPLTIEVGPLTPGAAERVAHAQLGGGPEARSLAAAVAAESRGNPFLIEALVGYLRSGAGPREVAGSGLSLLDMLRARVAALPVEAERLLTLVCVAGQPLPREVAQSAARLGPDMTNALALLRAQHLLRVRFQDDVELVEPYHDRIRETLVDSFEPHVRKREHLAVGVALESHGRADVEALADHFLQGGDLRKAAYYTARAAQRAAEILAFDRAAALYRQALDIGRRREATDTAAHDEERRLLLGLAGALVDAGRCAEAATAYLEAARTAPPAVANDARRRAGEQLLISGHLDEGKAILGEVMAAIDMRLPATPKRALASLLAWRARLRLRGLGFKRRDARTVPTAELSRIDLTWAVALGLGLVDHIRAADYQARSLYLSLESGEPFRIARSLALEVAYAAAPGQDGRARVERLRRVADALVPVVDEPHTTGIYAYSKGVSDFSWGLWPTARTHFEEARQVYRDRTTGLNWEVASNHLFLLSALGMLGDLAEIARTVPPLLEDALARGNVYAATNLRTGYPCLTWLALDEPETAKAMIAEAMAAWSSEGFHLQHYFYVVAETNLDLYCGRAERAWERMVSFWPGLEASLWQRVEIVRIDTFGYRARTAVAALAAGVDVVAARSTAEKDAKRLSKEAAAWAKPLALQTEAALRCLAGDVPGARTLLERAEKAYESVSMALHAAVARRRRGGLLGGAEGEALASEAEARIAALGARNPAAICDMLAPGFTGSAAGR